LNYINLNDYELFYLIEDSSIKDEIINIIYKKYKTLIYKIAKKFVKANSCIELDDLCQSGMVGLMYAINNYNPNRDVLFFTYASRCIKAQIIKYVISSNSKKQSILNNSISLDYQNNDDLPIKEYIADPNVDLYCSIINGEDYLKFLKFKHSLNFNWSCVLELRINGFKYDEIADLLDINKKSVDNIMRAIRQRLKKVYQFI
jgi:RNA polymerase sporulation-specific sigma factor